MSLAEWAGDRLEYAIAYDAPAEYVGIVARVTASLPFAESTARAEEKHPGGAFKCHVVQRTVTYGEWEPVR